MDPHYIEWRGPSYWVMEHRWDDMVDDIHILVTRLKEQNEGKLPPDLKLREENFRVKMDDQKGERNPDLFFDIVELALHIIADII